ncbi:MAG: hypothetical protein K2N70_07540 [Helicobacter sp.]|nr:hypothetical protein [Helicobacter sp.]
MESQSNFNSVIASVHYERVAINEQGIPTRLIATLAPLARNDKQLRPT